MATASESMFEFLEDTTANLVTAVANRLAENGVVHMLMFDETKDSLVYSKDDGGADDLRHVLTLDENYDSTTQMRYMTINAAGWLGIAATSGRLVFSNAALVELEDCAFEFNPDNDNFDFILNAFGLAHAFYLEGASGRIFLNSSGSPESAIEIDDDAGGADKGGICLQELSADHAAPSAGKVIIYAKDNGGDTTLYAIFPTGAAQVIAAEP